MLSTSSGQQEYQSLLIMRVRIVAPRRPSPIPLDLSAGETFGSVKDKAAKALGFSTGAAGILLLHGEQASPKIHSHARIIWDICMLVSPRHTHSTHRLLDLPFILAHT